MVTPPLLPRLVEEIVFQLYFGCYASYRESGYGQQAGDPVRGKDVDTSLDLNPYLSFPFGHSSTFSGKGERVCPSDLLKKDSCTVFLLL